MKLTNITIQLVGRSLIGPYGIIEDVMVKVENFIFLINFVVLEMKVDKDVLVIL